MKKLKKIIRFVLIIALIAAVLVGYRRAQYFLYPTDYSEYVEKYSEEFGVDKALVYSVIKCESSYNPDAESPIGAVGLMQITSDTFDWIATKLGESGKYSFENMTDPELNIRYGTYLLARHLNEFDDVSAALAAYHAGRGIVNTWLEDRAISPDGKTLESIPYKDTDSYVNRVQSVLKKYKKLYKF